MNVEPCRFNFPFELHGYYFYQPEEDGPILAAIRIPEIATEGATVTSENLVFVRNHPDVVTHIPEILIIWGGNTETRPTESYLQVLYYLLSYIMKSEKQSQNYKEMIKSVINEVDNDTNPRKLFSKILNKTIGERDITKQECFHILHGLPLVEFTEGMTFINVNLLRNRRISLEGRGTTVSGVKDHSDFYWRRATDANYIRLLEYYQNHHEENSNLQNPEDISLYQFARNFTMTWRLHHQYKIPHFIPNFFRIPKKIGRSTERYKLFLRARLLEHMPGTTYEGIFSMEMEELEAEMRTFLESPLCPNIVKEDFELSQSNVETDFEAEQPDLLHQPEGADDSTPQYEDWVEFVNPHDEADNVEAEENIVGDCDYSDSGIPIDHEYNWNEPRLELQITENDVKNLSNWLKETKKESDISYPTTNFTNVDTFNEEQFLAFSIVANYIQQLRDMTKPPQLFLNIHGSAGSGKTFWLLKVLSYCSHIVTDLSFKNYNLCLL